MALANGARAAYDGYMKNLNLFFVFSLTFVGACSSRVTKPQATPSEDPSVSALSENNNRELFLNRFLKSRATELAKLQATSVRVRETEASGVEEAQGTFALVSLLNEEAAEVGETSVFYFSKERSALKIEDLTEGMEMYLEQTGPQNAKLSTSWKRGEDKGYTEIYLLTPYSARVISNSGYALAVARDRAEFNRFKRSWKELSNTWSCKIKSYETAVCR